MSINSVRVVAAATMLMFCAQFVFPRAAFGQQAPTGPSTATAPPPVPPPVADNPSTPMPAKATISPGLAAALSNGITNSGNVVVDFGVLPGGVLDHGSNNFVNTGTLYAVSTNPAVTAATLQAQNIYNQPGATITTLVPTSLTAQYTGIVGSLDLILTAVESVVNAGTISSAGNLTVNAGTSIINAMQTDPITTQVPVMQAMSNSI